MKRITLILSILAASLLNNMASAEGYWGAKVSQVDVDSAFYDNAYNVGLIVGAEFGTLGGDNIVSLEGEFTTTAVKGDVSTTDWEMQTFGLYAALRTGKDIYLKAKAGLLSWDITLGTGTTADDTGFSYGFGGGIKLSSGHTLEIEYTVVEGDSGNPDINMLGVNYLF